MSPGPAADRAYRIDLVWAPDRGNGRTEQPGWTLYLDGTPLANTTHDLRPGTAQHWADAQLGEAVTWLPGAASWYFVAHPRRCGGESR